LADGRYHRDPADGPAWSEWDETGALKAARYYVHGQELSPDEAEGSA
jgi:hypothetical protein